MVRALITPELRNFLFEGQRIAYRLYDAKEMPGIFKGVSEDPDGKIFLKIRWKDEPFDWCSSLNNTDKWFFITLKSYINDFII
jgi:hypothetical protein